MILWFVILYLLASVGIGLYAARRVHSTKDFAVAGRTLPLPVVTATVFATWFGAETVLGIPATFVKEGLQGVVADPFGSSLCLILAGLFFARRFYRLNVLTIGDYTGSATIARSRCCARSVSWRRISAGCLHKSKRSG